MNRSEISFFNQPIWIKGLPFLAIYTVYLIGLFVDVMDVDASQYASIAREMLETGNYLQLFNRYEDYLDKPPLLFWLSAFSFKLLGVSNFAYKLPSFLFSLGGTFATYRLAKLYYGREVGYLSALLVTSCQAFFLFNHDVRTDTILTGSVILALWQLTVFLQTNRFLPLILGFTFVAAAMLTKGPMGLMIPVLAFSTDFILKRQWRNFFRWEWLVGIAWTGLLLLPMCIGLYQQFDLHPEKVMYGRSGTSGLRFFFWTQSFGRLTGESTWKNNADFFFLMHTFLWAFLPWCLLFIAGFYEQIKSVVKRRFILSSTEEALTVGGFLFPYLAFSTSKYQLPHYIFVLFPLAAIIAGKYLYSVLVAENDKPFIVWRWIQLFVVAVLWLAGLLLVGVAFPLQHVLTGVVLLGAFGLSLWFFFRGKNRFAQLALPALSAIVGVNFALNSHIYPSLFAYQSPSVAARYILAHDIDQNQVYCYKVHMHSLDFYSRKIIPRLNTLNELPKEQTIWIYTDEAGLQEAQELGLRPEMAATFDHFHISTLTLPFLNPNTRQKAVQRRYLIKITSGASAKAK
jgi:4-amino-4-deoxy-L-arabinose transferase-like glycosyltransferase